MKIIKYLTLAAILTLAASSAHAREFSKQLKPLLFKALETGILEAELGGYWATMFQQRFKSREPLIVKIKTLKVYKQQGCRQLNV